MPVNHLRRRFLRARAATSFPAAFSAIHETVGRLCAMRMLVLGAGLQGSACAYDLLQQSQVEQVTLADLHPGRLPPFLERFKSRRLKLRTLNAKSGTALRAILKNHDAVMCALPYYFNYAVARAAVRAGVHHTDLGGNTAIVMKQKQLDSAAQKGGVSVIPDCGLAPGMVNIIAAEGIRRVGEAESVKIYVGGLPQHPEPPLNYQIVYSIEGVLDYYTTPSWVLREGKPARVDALSELEQLEFPAPVGRLKAIRELGLLDTKPLKVRGAAVVPRDAFIAAAAPKLTKPQSRDLVALRVTVTGRNGKRAAWELLDRYDERNGISAMMRTTGYSLAITGMMQADGRIVEMGAHTPDEAVPFGQYVEELKKRGVEIREI